MIFLFVCVKMVEGSAAGQLRLMTAQHHAQQHQPPPPPQQPPLSSPVVTPPIINPVQVNTFNILIYVFFLISNKGLFH